MNKTTTLRELNPSEVGDDVCSGDWNVPLPVRVILPKRLRRLHAGRGDMSLMEIFHKFATGEQVRLVLRYKRELMDGASFTIVLDGDVLMDGYHRVVAAILAKKPLQYIDLRDLPN